MAPHSEPTEDESVASARVPTPGSDDGDQQYREANTVAEYRVPADSFALGRAVADRATATLERLVREGATAVQYVWIGGRRPTSFERTAPETTGIEEFTLLDVADGRRLYRVECRVARDDLLAALLEHPTGVLSGSSGDDAWRFKLGFPDRAAISTFQSDCIDGELGVKLDGVYRPVEVRPPVHTELTECQHRTLVRSYEEGYFEVPRGTTLVELAEQLDVSDQAVSERIRRAEEKLVRTHLLTEPPESETN